MNQRNTNLIVDMTNIFFRSMFVVGGLYTKYTFDDKKECAELMRKVAQDLCYIVRMFNPCRVYLCKDSKSWRKDIFIEENDGYKANRSKDNNINWDNVYGIMDEFLEFSKNYGMIVSDIQNAEADDCCALWMHELLYNRKEHCVIVSGDADLRQLIKTHKIDNESIFSIIFNPFKQGNVPRKLYVPENFIEWLKEDNDTINKNSIDDIFNINMSSSKPTYKDIINTILKGDSSIKLECINSNEIANKKIFCGDDGDNIPSLYTYEKEIKSGKNIGDIKNVRLTDSLYKKIIEDISEYKNEYLDYNILLERKQSILNKLEDLVKHKPNININDRLNRQIKLVVLEPELFPEEILNNFNKNKDNFYNNSGFNIFANIYMQTLLKNSIYLDKVNTVNNNVSDIFKSVSEIDEKISKSLF